MDVMQVDMIDTIDSYTSVETGQRWNIKWETAHVEPLGDLVYCLLWERKQKQNKTKQNKTKQNKTKEENETSFSWC